ncbi:MAG: adenylyl-sulfate reductase subunit alpha [Calditrichaeota bacterium]|nr:adenylyl-sulfate reductase subunit alpha [Calditrichota bacterium]
MSDQHTPDILKADMIVVGGGTAGLMAGILLKQKAPHLQVLVIEKAHAKRSGCLAMGLNAINLYLTDGNVDDYVDYVKRDTFEVVREDLVRSIGERANAFVPMLESFGVPFPRDADGDYIKRSRRSIVMRGERLKPILYEQALAEGVTLLNHSPVFKLIQNDNGRVIGVAGFNLRTGKGFQAYGRATLIATGGASGIYRPSNPETARKKTWYSPYNVGSGLAMGLRAGAEMTSFEMRFIALRTKDVIAPTGTLVAGTRVRQLNARGEDYYKKIETLLGRKLTTCERLFYQMEENRQGRGPCFIDLSPLNEAQFDGLLKSYLDMSPCLVLQLLSNPPQLRRIVEVAGSEPYINGGHGMAGYWVSTNRETTLKGLYAAGDVAGGAPKKYISGCFAEAEIAIEHFLSDPPDMPEPVTVDMSDLFQPLSVQNNLHHSQVEARLQKIMDEYAGGYSMNYATNKEKLLLARDLLTSLSDKTKTLSAANLHELMKTHEVSDRLVLARVLVEHMLARRETRWPAYQTRLDFPVRNDIEYRAFTNSRFANGDIEVFQRRLYAPYDKREITRD